MAQDGELYTVKGLAKKAGNINHAGDVLVQGDVEDGLEITATGSITVEGLVGACVLKGASITVGVGVRGDGKAVLEAADVLTAGFIENCEYAWAGGKIVAQSIMGSQVECEGDVELTGGKGLLSGGKLTALGSMVCNEIGNTSNNLTSIVLGTTPRLVAERQRIADNLDDVTNHLAELKKNVAQVERLVADGRPVPPDKVTLIQRARIALPLSEKKKEQLEAALAELEARLLEAVNVATLQSKVIYPPTKIAIGGLSSNIIEKKENCRVYKSVAGVLSFGDM